MDLCTIIAKNYLAAARVLADSLHEHHPEVRLHVLVIDAIDGYFDPASERFSVLQPQQLGIPDFDRMAGIYELLELSTAVKPWLLRYVLERSEDNAAVYLDPDTRLYGRLDDVFEAVREHGLVLNPHNTEPMPRDGRKPAEQDILIAGAYNLGFIGIARTEFADFLLDWWSERLETDCLVDPERGFFVDQRWIDFVPGMAEDYSMIRDPGFNVAYWNLATRQVGKDNGRYRVNDGPLRLFHFSGFDPERPHLLSKHQNRIRLADEPAVAELCSDYATALLAADHERASLWPYTYGKSHSGLALHRTVRSAFRKATTSGEVAGSLFEPEGEREFLDWCNSLAERGSRAGVTRYLEVLYESRLDLQVAYPDLGDAGDAKGFVGWAIVAGSRELPIPAALLPPVEVDMDSGDERPRAPIAVNVAGYLRSELGVGEVARQIIAALDTQQIALLPVGLNAPNSRSGHDFGAERHVAAPFDINLICVNADGLPAFARDAGPEFFARRHSIGVWWWELSEFPPQWHDSFDLLDEIWVGSRFVADALTAVSPIPVMSFPLPVGIQEQVEPNRAALGLPDGFVFLFSFDYNSVFKRKNPLGLVEAFARAFSPDDRVHLVVKSINHERNRDNHDRLRLAAEGHPHVHLMTSYLTAADKDRLTASCDAYISLHRSEGFGIGMAEALLRRKPVIATDYGGNTDFLSDATGYPVDYTVVEVGDDAPPYPESAHWAEPDLDHAATLMRHVVEHPTEVAERAERGAELIRTRHSAEAAGTRMARRLDAISTRRAQRGMRAGPARHVAPVDIPLARLDRGPMPSPHSPLGPLGRLARKVALRLMRPYTVHADSVFREVIEAVRQQDDTFRMAIRDAPLPHAADLAELRRLRTRLSEVRGLLDRLDDRDALLMSAALARASDLATRLDALETLAFQPPDRKT